MKVKADAEFYDRLRRWQAALHQASDAMHKTDDPDAREALSDLITASGNLFIPVIAMAAEDVKQRQAAAMN